jgi:hypothetical protein
MDMCFILFEVSALSYQCTIPRGAKTVYFFLLLTVRQLFVTSFNPVESYLKYDRKLKLEFIISKKEAIGHSFSYPYTNICLHIILKVVD